MEENFAIRSTAMLSRYAVCLAMHVAETAARNRLHNIEERLPRWLLIAEEDSGGLEKVCEEPSPGRRSGELGGTQLPIRLSARLPSGHSVLLIEQRNSR